MTATKELKQLVAVSIRSNKAIEDQEAGRSDDTDPELLKYI